MTKHIHGGDVYKYRNCLDFSANLNPLGTPESVKQAIIGSLDHIAQYPQVGCDLLREKIAEYEGVKKEEIVCGNGAAELFFAAVQAVWPQKALVIAPSFSEYEEALRSVGAEVEYYYLCEEDNFQIREDYVDKLSEEIDMIFLCNPNNPTSKVITKDQMDMILARCLELNIFVMVDETYVEFVKDVHLISSIALTKKYDNLIVLRSVSKFFASPGLRLGYAITNNEDFLEETTNEKTPWNINVYASVAGVMFSDDHYINLTKSLIQTERNLIYSALCSRKTIKVFKPEANFVLIKLLKEDQTASDVFDYCIKRGYMIRDCTDYEGLGDKYIRFCFMKPEQNDNVVNTILEIV